MTGEKRGDFMVTVERVVAALPRMSVEEQAALEAWEAENVTGDGSRGSTDWPGWPSVFARLEH